MNPEMLRSVSMRFRAKPALAPLAVEPRDAHKFPRLVGGTTMVPGEVAVFERDVVYHHPFYEHRPNESIVMVNGQVHTLTREENLFLQSLEGGPNNIISFKELKLKTFGSEWYSDNYIKFIALNVRQKIEPNPHTPQIILTKKYEGYLLFDPNMLPPKDSEEVYAHADWTHYPKGHFIIMNGKIIILTSFENAILTVLEQTPNKAVQPFVFDEFFREHEIVESTEVHQAMYKLRRKIDPHSSTDGKSRYLVSSEFGYILIDPNKPDSNEAPTPRKGELVYAHLAFGNDGGYKHYPKRRLVLINGKPTKLPPSENSILTILEQMSNRVAAYSIIMDYLWTHTGMDNITSIRVLVGRLRKRLGFSNSFIVARRGVGYTLIDPYKL